MGYAHFHVARLSYVAAKAICLRPASHAGLYIVAERVGFDLKGIAVIVIDCMRPWADK
jgi:hypothetical protein